MNRLALCAAGLLLSAAAALPAERTVMHCFAYTPIAEATQADWDAFHKATDALPQKIKGIRRVWHGKLARPLAQYSLTTQDAAARKKVMDEGKGTTDVAVARREYGVCMEFENEAAFKAYGPDPAHKAWEEVYGKVRRPGTTTFQIIPQ
jgi:hypothetical protein